VSGEYRVPVKSWLRAPTYRQLEAIAKKRGFPDVGSLLEQLAEKALGGKRRSTTSTGADRKAWTRMTPERIARLEQLHRQGLHSVKEIGVELGVSTECARIYVKRYQERQP
jgi:hypothetical protein